MILYLAADQPLSLIPWDDTRPAFHVTELPANRAAVRRQFSRPFVYYAGSHEGCGCGFQYGEYEVDDSDAEEWAEAALREDSRKRLVEYLKAALTKVSSVEVYACWDGDEALPQEHRDHGPVDRLLTDRTFFREREYFLVEA